MKKYLIIVILFIFVDNTFADCTFGLCNVDTDLKTTGNKTFLESITPIIKYLLSFTAFIGVAFVIKGGFQILTAAEDEEKVKNGRKTIIFSLIGLFIMFMAWTIVDGTFSGLDTISK